MLRVVLDFLYGKKYFRIFKKGNNLKEKVVILYFVVLRKYSNCNIYNIY